MPEIDSQTFEGVDQYPHSLRRSTDAIRARRRQAGKLSSGKMGAISELIVCADLIERGYDVYRAVSQSSDADLVAVMPAHVGGPHGAWIETFTIRVEVRTAYRSAKDGRLITPESDPSKYDVIARVEKGTGEIEYEPEVHSRG